ncbi:bifunctional [glutamate--ammonia ligase]-adenylyl-L-tyrosine phosphorylase/[glutamate--ammonia-ligase] adenylyltransferase [Sulfurihydrogenibium azorense]|uniref:bifunctional [glutamate--ammonia ligase]-adenylyl-L-tyrosine phosphorylase/[glutamate--ammonia-ligase] adenylyltransferase n=1 Tax=Sulfurihydrogenibium azorense TaxID=309806 RepID=UPI003919D3DE
MSNLFKFETLKKDFLDSLNLSQKQLLSKLAYFSSCISDFLFRHPEELFYIEENLNQPLLGRDKLIQEAITLLNVEKDEDFIPKLTYFKMKHFSRIVAKDIYKKHHLIKLTEEYSYLADACFEVAYRRAYKKHSEKYGQPVDEATGKVASGSVIALGKHGGTDLNYYSDVDVMYIYSGEGKTEKGISNREFFIKVFTDVNIYLTKRNFEGMTWNVDLDLRPEGKKGLLAYSIPFIESYYWSVGRTWERHMLIKARHAAGDENVSKEFLSIITPFVYRKSLSKDLIDEIFNMKKLIEESAKSKKADEIDIKKCEGGIREIEFIAQIFQLLHGGQNPDLRERETVKAIRKLKEHGILPEEDADKLENAYIFLRNLEHVIQLKNCTQTQIFNLKNADEYADKLGFSDTQEFLSVFNNHRKNVKSIFDKIAGKEEKHYTPLQSYIMTKQNEEEAVEYLKQLGFKDGKWALNVILEIFNNPEYLLLSEKEKNLLFDYISKLEKEIKDSPDKEGFIINLNKLFVEGNIYRIFLTALENKSKLIDFILQIGRTSDYITNIISKDTEIIDLAFSSGRPLVNEKDFLKELSILNIEDPIEKLKKLKKIVEVLGALDYFARIKLNSPVARLKKLNNIITNLADFIIKQLYTLNEGSGFAIFGLGKLGSKEMNIGSDLDLIFVFKDEESKLKYLKIPQKIVQDLTKYTKEGQLYQIDLRLRPYGKAGELSPTMDFYRKYFSKEARVWEVLAWTKSRFIAGDEDVKNEFESLIKEFLFSKKVDKAFKEEVLDMRLKLEGITKETESMLDIKLGKGGIADIEFMVQLFYLENKNRRTGILEGLLDFDPDVVDDYIFLREIETRLRLVKGLSTSKLTKDDTITGRIADTFELDTKTFWNTLKETKERVRTHFYRYFK